MKKSLSENVYELLKNDIFLQNPGESRILTEQMVADKYNVSRTPAREALSQLCSEGILTKYPKKGYMVNVIDEKYSDQREQIRFFLEFGIVRYAVYNVPDERIRELLPLCDCAASTPDELVAANRAFHFGLAACVDNPLLSEVLHSLFSQQPRPFSEERAVEASSVYNLRHRMILNAILERDVTKAEQAIENDIRGYHFT